MRFRGQPSRRGEGQHALTRLGNTVRDSINQRDMPQRLRLIGHHAALGRVDLRLKGFGEGRLGGPCRLSG